ncbi:tail fiber protein [Xanthomonas phage BUDD]|nr:tail fiber protein [Xanthomonas phage BUDD]
MASIKPLYINAAGLEAQAASGDTVPVDYGGTGLSSLTANSYLRAVSSSAFELRTPAQVLADIGALSTTGTAASATVLATARTINGTSFNGSANITTANWGTARTLTIGTTGKSVNGSANVAWSLTEIGAAPTVHTHVAADITDLQAQLSGRVERNTLQLNTDGTVPDGYFTGNSDTLTLKYSNNSTGSTGYPTEFGATLSVIMEKQAARSFDLHMPTNSPNNLYFRGYSSTAVPTAWKTIALLQNANTWSGKQSIGGGMNMGNDVLLEYGSGGAAIRGTSTGSIVIAAGSAAGAGIRIRPNGDTVTTGQVAIDTDGIVVATGFSGPLTGNATTATTLATARTINGTSFNGSANITTSNWGTARTLTIGGTGKSVNGSANVAWSLADIGAASADDVTTIQTGIGGDNQVGNGNFYTGTTVGWTSGNGSIGSATGTRTIVDSTLSSSGKAYRIDVANLPTNGYMEVVSNTSIKPIRVNASERAFVSVYARGSAGVRVFLQIRWNDETGAAISYTGTPSGAPYLTNETWTRYTHSGLAPANAVTANVYVRVYGNTATDQWFEFSHISLQVGAVGTGYAPSIDELRNDFNNLITTPNVWNQLQTFNGGWTLPNNKFGLLGTGGGSVRGTDTGSVVLSSGTGGNGYIYVRPNGDTSTTFQTVFYASGNVDMPTVRAGASTPNAAGAVMLELVSERSWQFRQRNTGATTQLELYDMTGAKDFVLANNSNTNVIVMNPTNSSISATTFTGSLTGNATTATTATSAATLTTARTINGTSFNGSANITTSNWGTARNITIGSTTKSVNGSGNVSWTLAEIGAVDATGFVKKVGDTMTGDLTVSANVSGQMVRAGFPVDLVFAQVRSLGDGSSIVWWESILKSTGGPGGESWYRAKSHVWTNAQGNIIATLETGGTFTAYNQVAAKSFLMNDTTATSVVQGNLSIYDSLNARGVMYFGGKVANTGNKIRILNPDTSTSVRIDAVTADASAFAQMNFYASQFTFITGRIGFNGYLNSTANLAVLSAAGGTVYLRPNGADSNTGASYVDSSGAMTVNGQLWVGGHALFRGNGRNVKLFDNNNDTECVDIGAGIGTGTDRGGYVINRNAGGELSLWGRNGSVQLRLGMRDGVAGNVAQLNVPILFSAPAMDPNNAATWSILTTGSYGGGIGMRDNAGNGNYFGGMYVGSGQMYIGVGAPNEAGIRASVVIKNDYQWYFTGNTINVEGSSPTIRCYDNDQGFTSWIHHNDGNHGFLAHNSFSWACFRNSGNDWQCQNNIIAYASDRRLKKNIVDAPNDIVEHFFENVRIRQFDWDEEKIAHYKVGIKPRLGEVGAVAQEMQAVYADAVAVNEAHNQIKTKDNPNPEKPNFLTIDWTKTVPLLIAEVQNLRRRVAQLENRA